MKKTDVMIGLVRIGTISGSIFGFFTALIALTFSYTMTAATSYQDSFSEHLLFGYMASLVFVIPIGLFISLLITIILAIMRKLSVKELGIIVLSNLTTFALMNAVLFQIVLFVTR